MYNTGVCYDHFTLHFVFTTGNEITFVLRGWYCGLVIDLLKLRVGFNLCVIGPDLITKLQGLMILYAIKIFSSGVFIKLILHLN